jgi:hypothetical protein
MAKIPLSMQDLQARALAKIQKATRLLKRSQHRNQSGHG